MRKDNTGSIHPFKTKGGVNCLYPLHTTVMGHYHIKSIQRLPISLDEAWEFFSSPDNLGDITPKEMNFRTLFNSFSKKMYAGQIITYKVSPLFGIPMFWMTEITHVKDKEYFIDEQRYGPYSMWHHVHFFKAIPGGVEMTDIVSYVPPFGFLGDIVNAIFLQKKVQGIFDYRTKVLEERFGRL